jgi:GABA(A) receptor-associated protein
MNFQNNPVTKYFKDKPAIFFKDKYFKDKYLFDKRKTESHRITEKYPDRVPFIVERAIRHNDVPLINKNKYLVPVDFTIGEFIQLVRSKMKLSSSVGIFLFFDNNMLVTSSELAGDSYRKYKDPDGFLYIKYSGENVFGYDSK